MNDYAGRSQDERVARRKHAKQPAQEPPGGEMAVPGTEPDRSHSSGELSEQGKEVWRKGAGLDGGGRADEGADTPSREKPETKPQTKTDKR